MNIAKLLKSFVGLSLFASFTLSASVCLAAPAQIPPKLKQDLMKTMSRLEKEGPENFLLIEEMKKAGASYIPELAAPTANVVNYANAKSQRIMSGIYLFDLSYASEFDKKKESLATAEAIDTLQTKLGQIDKQIRQKHLKAIEQYRKTGSKEILRNLDKQIDASWQKMMDTPDRLLMTIDGAYGWLIEGLYITTEIVAQQNYSPKFLSMLNQQRKTVLVFAEVMEIIKNEQQVAEWVGRKERILVLDELKTAFKADPITENGVEALRKTVSRVRAELIK